MERQNIAARFLAFTWHLNSASESSPDEAGSYARRHWQEFLPYASKDIADVLTSPTAPQRPRRRAPQATSV